MNNRPWRFSIQKKTRGDPKNNSFDDGKRMLDERGMQGGCQMLDTGYWILDTGCWIGKIKKPASGRRIKR